MKNKYDICINVGLAGEVDLDVYSTESPMRTIKNKEEWKLAMKEDNILDFLWKNYVEDYNKDEE